jgi:2'-5' RNA ligase
MFIRDTVVVRAVHGSTPALPHVTVARVADRSVPQFSPTLDRVMSVRYG